MKIIKMIPRNLSRPLSSLRQSGMVPGIVYGPIIKDCPIKLSLNELKSLLREKQGLYCMETPQGKKMVRFDEVQRTPVARRPLHFSLVEMAQGAKAHVAVPLLYAGEEFVGRDKGVVVEMKDCLHLIGLPKNLPLSIEVDLSQMKLGDKITVGDLNLPREVEVDEEDLVLAVCNPSPEPLET